MDFIERCKLELNNIECDKICFYGDKYYSLECIGLLPSIIMKIEIPDELMITPYYFIEGEILELYEYKLSIQIVKEINNKKRIFLEETGKKNLNDIPVGIRDLLDYTYYEILENDMESFIKSLKRYITYMSKFKTEILSRVRLEIGGENELGSLYFEIL